MYRWAKIFITEKNLGIPSVFLGKCISYILTSIKKQFKQIEDFYSYLLTDWSIKNAYN